MKTSLRPLNLAHSDLCRPMPAVKPSGNRCMLTRIDDHSRFTVVRFLYSKGETTSAIMEYAAKAKAVSAENQPRFALTIAGDTSDKN
ncbi:hypothetical protein M514_00074 [Trichuris suis]|uniref:Uncharacterized protein n=1 Tax=Trichuris suis TaxID=68888 RepID=A0A085NTZ3_9BILA|nr:hypothetical protein M513_00074 [Trichuris suis]KFD72939.1 hypothetical protein M514_00074 [Trichuris suis]